MKKKKKMEFSKLLILILSLFFIVNFEGILIFVCVMCVTTKDTSCFNQLLIGFFGLMTAILTPSIAFYYWKSKNENAIKIKEEYAKLQNKYPNTSIDASLVSNETCDDALTATYIQDNIDFTNEGR